MKRNKGVGISNQLKLLYTVLFALSICIVFIFHIEQCRVNQHAYNDKLSRYIEALSVQIEGEDLDKINLDNLPHTIDVIEEIPEYNILRAKVMKTASILDIPSSEIRLVKYSENQGSIITILSSEKVYKFGEIFRDRTNYFQKSANESYLTKMTINEDLEKIYAYRPIMSKGMVKAHLVLSAPALPFMGNMNTEIIKNSLIILAIYMILGVFFIRSLRRNRLSFAKQLIKSKSFTEKLESKNKDLEMLSLIAKTSKDLILITDQKGAILWINDSYKNKNNYSSNELEKFIGQSILKMSRNKNIGNIIKNANAFKEEFTYETRSLDLNGNEFYSETLVKPVLKNSDVIKIIFIDQNITELMHYKEMLQQKEALSTTKIIKHSEG